MNLSMQVTCAGPDIAQVLIAGDDVRNTSALVQVTTLNLGGVLLSNVHMELHQGERFLEGTWRLPEPVRADEELTWLIHSGSIHQGLIPGALKALAKHRAQDNARESRGDAH